MNKNEWTLTDVLYGIQFALFWLTSVGGIVAIILTIIHKMDYLPLWGVIIIYVVVEVIQLAFIVVSSKGDIKDTEDHPEPEILLKTEEETIEEEFDNLKALKERIQKEKERRRLNDDLL